MNYTESPENRLAMNENFKKVLAAAGKLITMVQQGKSKKHRVVRRFPNDPSHLTIEEY